MWKKVLWAALAVVVLAVAAYLRTLPPVENQAPPREIDFPVSLFIKAVPQPLEGAVPPVASSVARRPTA